MLGRRTQNWNWQH